MMNENVVVMKELLKVYPDVIKNLGGEVILNDNAVMERLTLYINNHKWYVNQKLPFTVTFEEALFSWYENVFIPQKYEMDKKRVYRKLKEFTPFEQFDMVSNEYYYQSKKNNDVFYDTACVNLIKRA